MPAGELSRQVQFGDIVAVADLLDPQGRNPKNRPCVVVTDPKLPPPQRTELVVAISTVIPSLIPADFVLLPWQDPHHPVTGLNKRNAAICSWIAEVENSRILRKIGVVPGKQLRQIAWLLANL